MEAGEVRKHCNKGGGGDCHQWYLICIQTILSCDRVTIGTVWIGSVITWTLTERNYKWLRQFHWVIHSKVYCNYSTHKVFSAVISRCLVTTSNGRRIPSSGFPKCPRASAASISLLNWLSACRSFLDSSLDSRLGFYSSWRQAPWDSRPEIFVPNGTLAAIVLMQHPLWREDGFMSYEYAWPFVKCTYCTHTTLKNLPFSL
jgi:hypothetical protein